MLSVICIVLFTVLAISVHGTLQPDDWQKFIAERRKGRQPSPQQLTEKFREADTAKKKSKKEHETYLKSPAYHAKMLHAGNIIAQKARHQSAIHAGVTTSQCGMTFSLANVGYKNTEIVRDIFHLADSYHERDAFLQNVGNPGMSFPGAGAHQVTKDEGRSIGGKFSEAGESEHIDPYIKVYKDGYSFALCTKDVMYDFGDKYGSNKDQYQKQHLNVSIVLYSEIVLKENQKSMTPKVCFEFCRTVPNMGYFGIRSGRDCYCTPFFTKAESETESCDMSCPGDPSQMCGGKTKSQIFEMHMCADTAGDLLYSAVNAEQELVYMYDTIFMTDQIALWLDKTGQRLKKVAGLGGDPGAADLAQLAINEAVSLFDDSTGWGVCRRQYVMLLQLYIDAKPLFKADNFTHASAIQKAEDTIMMMDNLKSKLHWCAKRSEGPIKDTFPFYFELMGALDEKFFQAALDKFADSLVMYLPALYSMDPQAEAEMSTCTGTLVAKPMAVTLSGCAEACNRMVTHPNRCTAFQYFQIQDGDNAMPLCFLFREIETIRSHRCEVLQSFAQTSTALRGQSNSASKQAETSNITQRISTGNKDLCNSVKQAKRFSGLSCSSIFGLRSKIIKACPDECADNQGMKYTALCMTRISASTPRIAVTQGTRAVRKCFGSGNIPADQTKADFRLVEFGQDASGGAGPKIEGDLHMDGTVIKEPYGYIWTPGPAGFR